jgi:hypothetical protein
LDAPNPAKPEPGTRREIRSSKFETFCLAHLNLFRISQFEFRI